MENSTTNSSVKSPSGRKENKTSGFPGFINEEFKLEDLEKMPKKELYRFYKLYGAQIVKNFYSLVGAITTPTKFKLEDFPKRELVEKRVVQSSKECSKMMLWMKNTILLNDIVYRKLILGEVDGNEIDTGEVKKSKKCSSKQE